MPKSIWNPFQGKPPLHYKARFNPEHPLNNHLVAWWLLNECAGPSAYSVVNSRFTGTLYGHANLSGGNLTLDGTDDYVRANVIPFSGYPFTVSILFRTTDASAAYRSLFSLSQASASSIYYVVDLSDTHKATIRVRNTTQYITTGALALNDGNWHTIVADFASATDRNLYVDGVQDTTSEVNTSCAYNTLVDNCTIGRLTRDTPSNYFPGTIAIINLYDKSLTSNEILALYRYPYGTAAEPRLLIGTRRKWLVPSGEAPPEVNATPQLMMMGVG